MGRTNPTAEASASSDGRLAVGGWLGWLFAAATFTGCAIIVFALVGILYAVVMRYFVGQPVRGVDELSGYLVIWLLMAGMAGTLLKGGHIGIDLLTSALHPRFRRGLGLWSNAAVLLFAVLFGWSAWHTIAFNRGFGTYSTGYLEVEMWLVQLPLLAGAVLLGLAALVNIVRALQGRRP